ncbi:MAG: mechanosensitive ion channel [Bdellovibrionales bacterium]
MFQDSLQLITSKLHEWSDTLVVMFPNLILAALALYISIKIAKGTSKPFQKLVDRFASNKAVASVLAKALFVFVLGVGLFIALSILKLDKAVTSLLAGAGVIGLALGFAFQEIMSNFVSGILISFQQPFKVGDIVEPLKTIYFFLISVSVLTTMIYYRSKALQQEEKCRQVTLDSSPLMLGQLLGAPIESHKLGEDRLEYFFQTSPLLTTRIKAVFQKDNGRLVEFICGDIVLSNPIVKD